MLSKLAAAVYQNHHAKLAMLGVDSEVFPEVEYIHAGPSHERFTSAIVVLGIGYEEALKVADMVATDRDIRGGVCRLWAKI